LRDRNGRLKKGAKMLSGRRALEDGKLSVRTAELS